jgi:hypothetical protein
MKSERIYYTTRFLVFAFSIEFHLHVSAAYTSTTYFMLSHSLFPYLETVILLIIVNLISSFPPYFLSLLKRKHFYGIVIYEIFCSDKMCHQKLDSSVSKMSTLMSANGPLLEKFGLDTIHTDVLSFESCR